MVERWLNKWKMAEGTPYFNLCLATLGIGDAHGVETGKASMVKNILPECNK